MARYLFAVALLASIVFLSQGAKAADTKLPDAKPADPKAAAPKPADDAKALGTDGCNHTEARAGFPRDVSKRAAPSNTDEYFGYYVGGSCLLQKKGGEPGPLDGTYGWDYGGHKCWLKPKIVLNFCYGCRYKGGIGAYTTDQGPHVVNIPGLKLPEREHDAFSGLNCNGKGCKPCK